MEDLSLADIRAATQTDGFLGGGSGTLIILFLIIMLLGGGAWGNRGDYGQFATAASQQEILFGQHFQNIDNKIDRLGNGIADATFALNNSVINEGRNMTNAVGAGFTDMQKGFCETLRSIDGATAAINATSTANTQKILDAISTNRIQDMQNQINALQLQNAMCGVVRYPSASTYYAGNNPFCANTCGCNS